MFDVEMGCFDLIQPAGHEPVNHHHAKLRHCLIITAGVSVRSVKSDSAPGVYVPRSLNKL